jgi:hypothetical protein
MSQAQDSLPFSEPVSPAARYGKEVKSGSKSNMNYSSELAGGKWQVETEEPKNAREQVRTST